MVVLATLGLILLLTIIVEVFVRLSTPLQSASCVIFGVVMPPWFSALWKFASGVMERFSFGAVGFPSVPEIANPSLEIDSFIDNPDSSVWDLDQFQGDSLVELVERAFFQQVDQLREIESRIYNIFGIATAVLPVTAALVTYRLPVAGDPATNGVTRLPLSVVAPSSIAISAYVSLVFVMMQIARTTGALHRPRLTRLPLVVQPTTDSNNNWQPWFIRRTLDSIGKNSLVISFRVTSLGIAIASESIEVLMLTTAAGILVSK